MKDFSDNKYAAFAIDACIFILFCWIFGVWYAFGFLVTAGIMIGVGEVKGDSSLDRFFDTVGMCSLWPMTIGVIIGSKLVK